MSASEPAGTREAEQPEETGPAPGKLRRRLPALLVGLLLALYAALAISSMAQKTATYDETAHLPAGYSHLALGDFRLNPEHPPLVKMIAALPLLLVDIRVPPPAQDAWVRALTYPASRWLWGHALLFSGANDPGELLLLGRLPMVALALLLGLLIWRWALALHGPWAAAATVALFALDPNMLAHGRLVATDLPVTTFTFGAFYLLWRGSRELTLGRAAGAALFAAAALASKFSAVLLLPYAALALGVRALHRAPWSLRLGERRREVRDRLGHAGVAAGMLLAMGLTTWLGIFAVYGFRFAPTADPEAHFPVASLVKVAEEQAEARGAWQPQIAAAVARTATAHHLLPEAWSFGFLYATLKAQQRRSYLLGEVSDQGWRSYFPIAMGVKTPLPTLLLALLGIALLLGSAWRRHTRGGRADGPAGEGRAGPPAGWAFLVIFPTLYLALAVLSNLNIGLRHVLPIYPFLYLAAGRGLRAIASSGLRLARVLGAVLMLWLLAGTLAIHPHYLAYFNEVAGGPEHGADWLVDSNLDWGQDLRLLGRWMRDHGVPRVNLAYFGTADPRAYGISALLLPVTTPYPLRFARRADRRLPLAISVTHRVGLELSDDLRAFYRDLLRGAERLTTIGHSIEIYRLAPSAEPPPSPNPPPGASRSGSTKR